MATEEIIDLENVKVTFPDKDTKKYPKPLALTELLNHKSLSSKDIIALMVNGEVKSLNSSITFGTAKVAPLLKDSYEGSAMYRRTLVQILATAAYQVYSQEFNIIVHHHVNNGYLVKKADEKDFTEEEISKIKEKMTDLIKQDLPIKEVELSHEEAISYFTKIKHKYSVSLIETNNTDIVKCSYIDNFMTLFFRPLGKSTGVITDFDVRLSSDKNSLLLLFPTATKPIPKNLEEIETKLTAKSYSDSLHYNKIINIECVGDWNKVIISNPEKLRELMLTMSMHQESQILSIANQIAEKVINGKVKFVGIAGPSASGKTTFSKKLGLALKSKGIEPIVISMDDYFKDTKDAPVDEKGNKDFECLEALRVDDFNKDLKNLFKGQKIKRCIFNFVKGTHSYGEELQMPSKESGKTGIVLCEGLHGIDDKATKLIPRDEKFFIYIAPLTPINSDEYNFFADHVLRLYRRMIRDFRTRGRAANMTLHHWFSVAKGEEKYIFPHIDSSDLIWNTALDYEVSVLYPFVYPLLRTVSVDDPNYYLACYLMNTMSAFLPISDEEVEKTAVLREFIGGSLFE
jgi:uridine kinase